MKVELTPEQLRDLRIECGLSVTRARLTIWVTWLRWLNGAAPEGLNGKVRSLEGFYRPRRARTAEQYLQVREHDRQRTLVGAHIEAIVRALPDKHRRAVRAHWVHRALPLSKRIELVGVAKSRYYELVQTGELMVRNHLYADALFRAEVDLLIDREIAELMERLNRTLRRLDATGRNTEKSALIPLGSAQRVTSGV